MYNAIFFKQGTAENHVITVGSLNRTYGGKLVFTNHNKQRFEIEPEELICLQPVTCVCGYWISNDQISRTDYIETHSEQICRVYFIDTYTVNNIPVRLYKFVTNNGNIHFSVNIL